jgi:hypothetical protein
MKLKHTKDYLGVIGLIALAVISICAAIVIIWVPIAVVNNAIYGSPNHKGYGIAAIAMGLVLVEFAIGAIIVGVVQDYKESK